LNVMTLGILPKLRKAAWFPAKKINRIARGLETKFVREFAGDPKRMTSLIKMSPDIMKGGRQGAESLIKARKSLGPDGIAHLNKEINKLLPKGSKARSLQQFEKQVSNMSSKEIMQFFDAMKKTPGGQGYLDIFGKDLARSSMNKNNPAWNLYANNSMKNFAAAGSTAGMKSTDWLKLEGSFAKTLDIWWNELQDIGSDLGLKKNDDAEGVIYHMMKESVKYAMPDFTSDIAENIPKFGKTAKTGVSVATGGFINPNEWEDYDPEDNAGGDFA
jgi:hypothetical protein